MKEYKLTISSITPSLNKLIRTHFRGRMELKENLGWEVMVATYGLDIPPATEPLPRTVKITSYRVSLLDEDNLIGGTKPLTDCLVDQKLIYDDRPTLLELHVEQRQVKKRSEQRTEITISF